MEFRICVIGCGYISRSSHGPSYVKYAREREGVILAGCCDIDEGRAADYKAGFGFKSHYTDIDAMLRTEKPDAVCITVPVELSAAIAGKVMGKGYPVIMEKPPAKTVREVSELMDIAERMDVPNCVAFNRRYSPMVRELKKKLADQFKTGVIQNISFEMYRVNRKDPDFSTTAIHGIDTVRFLAGSDYKTVEFRYQELPDAGPGVTNIFMHCEFHSGATAQLRFFPVSGMVAEKTLVTAENNTLLLNYPAAGGLDMSGWLRHFQNGRILDDVSDAEVCKGMELFESTGFYFENSLFFDDLAAGRKPEGDLKTALQAVEAADCIRNRLKIMRG